MKKINEKYISQIFETDTEYSEWFGYYNYDVLNVKHDKMLCNRVSFDARAITREDTVELGYYDLTDGSWSKIDTSDSFNWQQGAMLQWLSGDENENKVIYNLSVDNSFKSVICDIDSGEKKYIDFPVYCVTPDGRFAISLNYERSYFCRAYHYQSVVNPAYDVRVAEDDGVFKVDLENNTVERMIDIKDVIETDFQADFDNAKHWLEHIMINSSGTRIAFLHRFSYGNAYTTRLFVADADGKNMQIIKGWRNNDWSHFGWCGDDEFVIYSIKKNAFQSGYAKQVQKAGKKFSPMAIVDKIVHLPILRGIKNRLKPSQKMYEHFRLDNGVFVNDKNYDNKKYFSIDGHPSFTRDGKYMITDSYPDESGYQFLYIFNTETRKCVKVGEFKAPLKGNPASCDLHPKLSRDSQYVAVDTAHTGRHKLCLFKINWEEVKSSLD